MRGGTGRGKGVGVLSKFLAVMKVISERRMGVTINELCRRTGVPRRNMYRYLNEIVRAKLPLVSERNPRSRSGREKLWRFAERLEWMQKIGIL